ncbi:DUF3794 and LysM peptidoglycan-binding domain-containing protein [Desulfofalx alkaliphila]|uniref:DUF3794 and LysM peptidoglycan-binding domain-containing protein n=1 Tax=Desulfofalx alkaliphila TaxID=105483 RepID=UPI0004E13FF8|nr:SPOCS domain-containing protein [Desulfofalx alkaliphila]
MKKTRKNKQWQRENHRPLTTERSIRINCLVSEKKEKTIVRHKITIPDHLPPLAEILSANHAIIVDTVEIVKGIVVVDGVIYIQITYSSAADNHKHQYQVTVPYSDFINIAEAEEGMTATVNAVIEDLSFTSPAEERPALTLDVRVSTRARVYKVQQLNILVDVAEPCSAQRDCMSFNQVVGMARLDFEQREEINIPDTKPEIKEILSFKCTPVLQNYRADFGAITVNGWLKIELLYLDNRDKEQLLQRLKAFSTLIPLAEARPEQVPEVHICSYTSSLDRVYENKCLCKVECKMALFACVLQAQRLKVVSKIEDCNAELLSQDISYESLQSIKNTEVVIRDVSPAPEEKCEVKDVRVGPVAITSADLVKGKALIRGSVEFVINYTLAGASHGGNLYRKVPFKSVVRVKSLDKESRVDALPIVNSVQAAVYNGKLTLDALIGILVRQLCLTNQRVITGAKFIGQAPGPLAADEISFLYRVKKGESLESIAKRFGTTVESIIRLNGKRVLKGPLENEGIRIPCQVKNGAK